MKIIGLDFVTLRAGKRRNFAAQIALSAPANPFLVTPIPYQKVVVGEAYSYNLAQHVYNAHTFAVAPGSALPSGMTLSAAGWLDGVATVAGMRQIIVIRATNTVSGLSADFPVDLSAAQRPGNLPAPTLTELSSTSFRVTRPALPENTPALSTSVDMLFGQSLPLNTSTGSVIFNAFPSGTTYDFTVLPAGSTRHVTLRAKVLWGDGTFLTGPYSSNVAAITLTGANSAPSYSVAPSISPATGAVGAVFTLAGGTVSGQPTPSNTLVALTQNGVDVLAQVSAGQFTSTEAGPLVATWQAVNGVSPAAQATATATISASAQAPAQMAAPTGTVISASQIDVTLAAAPADGGATITSYEIRYSLDQVNWTVIVGLTAGATHSILGLLSSTAYYIQNAARNAAGLGPWSPPISRTTSAASGASITFGQYTAVGGGAKAIGEADGTYGQFTVSGGQITPNTSPLTVGNTTVGSTTVAVIANEASVASMAEFAAARTAMGTAGGRTLRFRAGNYTTTTDYVLASAAYTSLVTIIGEAGVKFTGNVFLNNPSNLLVKGLEIHCTDTSRFAIIQLSGACTDIRIEDNYLHGVTRDPLGDYSVAGSYQNPDKGIGCASGTQLNGCSIKRNRIEHVKEGIVLLIGGANAYDVWDNDIGYTYSDATKIAIYAAGALTAPKRWLRNWWYMMVGRQDDAGGNGPHSDFFQEVRTTFSDGQTITGLEFKQNVWLNTGLSRGYNIQGLFSASDGGGRRVWKDAIVTGNVAMSDTAHFISLMVDGGVFAHNTLVTTTAAKGGAPLGKFSGQGGFRLDVSGANPLLLRNVTNIAPVLTGTATQTDNILLGNDGATIAYATAMAGPSFEPSTWSSFLTAYTLKTGGPLDLTFGRGAIGSGIGTWGARRDPSGWTYNALYEQVNPSSLTALTIANQGLPVYDSNPLFTGVAAVPVSGTHDTFAGDTLQYRVLNFDTDEVIQDWTDFAAGAGGTWSVMVNRPPSFTALKVAVRGKVATSVTATQTTKWRSGYIIGGMGQSLMIRPLTHNFAASLTPSSEKFWVLYNDVNGSLAAGPILANGSAVLGPRRMAEVVAAYGDGPIILVDMAEGGTGRDATSDAEEVTNRSWQKTMQAPVDYIRARGSDLCLVMDHWFTNEATTFGRFARWALPFYTRQMRGGVGVTDDGTGVQAYNGQPVTVAGASTKVYAPVHFLFDLTGQGGGLFDHNRTRWFPYFGMAAGNITNTRYEPGSDTSNTTTNAWAANDRQKGSIRRELELCAESDTAYYPITLRSLPGWSGPASFGGHIAAPEGTHVADTVDGESTVAPYMAIAMLRAIGKLPRAEPRFQSAIWAPSGSKVTVRISLPHGNNLSTPYIEYTAGSYVGSFEATNWVAPSVLPETTDQFLKNVQGFSIKRASNGLRYRSGFTATITNTGTGAGAARYGEVEIVPTTPFENGDSIAFGLYDGVHLATTADIVAGRPHMHWPIETRAHVSGAAWGWPVVRESATLALATATGISGTATAPSAFVAGNWTLTNPALSGKLRVTISALPADGGSALTDLQWTKDAGATWTSFGAATVGTYDIAGFTNGVSASAQIRAINAVGAGAASDTKSATPTGDTTAPVLSLPTDTASGSTTASGGVTTDEGNGTLYWVVTASATAPTKAQVKAGQNNGGTAAVASGSKAVTATGAQSISVTGLTASTAYYMHFMHEDAAGNQSNVASGDGFTTSAPSMNPTVVQASQILTSFDGVGKNSWTSDAFTVGSGAGRALLFEISGVDTGSTASANSPTLSGTFNGQTVTFFGYRYHGSDRGWLAFGYLANPTSGAGTLSLASTSNQFSMSVVASELNDASATTPGVLSGGTATSGNTRTVNGTTTAPNSLLVGVVATVRRTAFPSADATITDGTSLGASHSGGATDLKTGYYAAAYKLLATAGAGSVAFSWPEATRHVWQSIEVFKA